VSRLRAEIWVAAFVRRLNSSGDFCVVSRRGDKDAGQVWVEVDHLNGNVSLYAPAPANPEAKDRAFVTRIDQGQPSAVRERLALESDYDPDFWVISVETRKADIRLNIVQPN